jgi:hypothetical protein
MQTFEEYIKSYLNKKYGSDADELYNLSYLLQYLVYKTKSANRGAKARGSFANLYAIYVLVEDYIQKGYGHDKDYCKYEGAQFSVLLDRQRKLPFGTKLQNHALNSRMNDEFFKYFSKQRDLDMRPIIRDLEKQRYWFNENYLIIKIGGNTINIANDVITIIDTYVEAKQDSFKRFITQCEQLQRMEDGEQHNVLEFIMSLLAPNVDARLFEIVSYSIMKNYFKDTRIFWGYTQEELNEEYLKLYKTGRTNANDGGIDFVMKPLGRFFQVTETLDFKKYFLDIEKIEKYPISFVIKTNESCDDLKAKLKANAKNTYRIEAIVDKYLNCIEEIINIPVLRDYLHTLDQKNEIESVLSEIILQSKVEFNYSDEDDE